jgi:hypothetical protein
MIIKSIEVPGYVADEFNRPLTHPSKKANAVELSLDRVYRLIDEALKGIDWPDWEVSGRRYHSPNDVEPYGFERVGDKFYIYAEERGRRTAMAVFKDDHMAAKYFVWLVSKGSREIDWELFLDMEP